MCLSVCLRVAKMRLKRQKMTVNCASVAAAVVRKDRFGEGIDVAGREKGKSEHIDIHISIYIE